MPIGQSPYPAFKIEFCHSDCPKKTYNGSALQPYYYHKNLQGDVIAIYDESGNIKAEYAYDAYGNCKIIKYTLYDLAVNNPIRYRGYYLDRETKLYYLNTRYYNPEWRRFISPDSTNYLAPESVNGLNLYVYCGNDPVMNIDPNGTAMFSFLVGMGIAALIGAVVGAASYTVSEVISYSFTGNWTWTWGGFLGSVVSSAIVGAFAFAVPEVAVGWCAAINGYLSTSMGMLFENAFGEANNSGEDILFASFGSAIMSGAFAGFTSLIKLPGFTGRGSITQVHKQIFTKFSTGKISKIAGKTFGKLMAYESGYVFFNTIANGIIDAINTTKYIRKLSFPKFAPRLWVN